MIEMNLSLNENFTIENARRLAEELAEISNVNVSLFVIDQQPEIDITKIVEKRLEDDHSIPLMQDEKIISLEEIEREVILNALRETDHNMSRTAIELGIGRTTLYRKLQKHKIFV